MTGTITAAVIIAMFVVAALVLTNQGSQLVSGFPLG